MGARDEITIGELASATKEFIAKVNAGTQKLTGRQDEVDRHLTEVRAELLDLQQKLNRRPGDTGDYMPSSDLRETLKAASAQLAAVADRKARRAIVELPSDYFGVKAQITSTGIAMPDQRPGIVKPAERRVRVRSLIPSVPTAQGSIQYQQETSFTNNAQTVSEGDQKPESNATFQLKTVSVVVIAHWIRVTLQALSDVPTMQAYIDGRLRHGLEVAEDLQLLKGSGVGNNLNGLYTAATPFSGLAGGGTRIDRIRAAQTQLELADFKATGICLNPIDWQHISLQKDSQGRYIFGDPHAMTTPMLWGLPVISTSAMTADTFLVGAFDQAALIYDREDARVDISTETEDDFITNRAHVRAEERLALAILRPTALVKGDLNVSGA